MLVKGVQTVTHDGESVDEGIYQFKIKDPVSVENITKST